MGTGGIDEEKLNEVIRREVSIYEEFYGIGRFVAVTQKPRSEHLGDNVASTPRSGPGKETLGDCSLRQAGRTVSRLPNAQQSQCFIHHSQARLELSGVGTERSHVHQPPKYGYAGVPEENAVK